MNNNKLICKVTTVLMALLMSAGLVWASPPVVMKVLVLAGSTNEPSYQAITTFLAQIGVPYQAVVLSSLTPNSSGSRLPQVPLSDTATGDGLYQGIILTDSTFAACSSSCLSTADWTTLNTYATQFKVRIASYYTAPAAKWGLTPVGAVQSYTATSPLNVSLTAAGAALFPYLNSANQIPITGQGTSAVKAYLATPVAAVNETTIPLLTTGANTVAVTHTTAAGQEILALTMDNAPTLTHSFAFGYGVINWVTKGMFLGSRKVYLNNQTDDLLLGNWIYAPSQHPACEDSDTCPTYFETGPDLQALATWQANLHADPLFQSYRQTFAINGVGTTWFDASDPIFAAMKSLNSQFWWMSHTWDHPNLDCYATSKSGACVPATLAQSLSELNQNISAVPKLGITFDEIGMVTPYNSGLSNTAFLQAAAQVGIKYIVIPSLPASPNTGIVSAVPSLLLVTRLNNDLYYDVSSPLSGVNGSWPDEYNAQYGPGGTNPTFSQNQTYSQILDNLSQQFLQTNMFTYSPYVIESHIANVATYDGKNSVFTDLMNATITKYEKLFTLPVLSVNLEDIGALLQARTNYNASGVVGVYTPGVSVVLTTTNAASIPLTGICSQTSCAAYGGQIQDNVVMASNSTVTIPLSSNVGVSLSSVAVSPTTVNSGASTTGTVTLSGAAPTGGVSVSLSSNNAAATVPASVTVAAGSTTATFTVSTTAVTSAVSATLTASYSGGSKIATLTIGTVNASGPALRFIPVPPCRVADTRNPGGPFGGPSLTGQSTRNFTIPESSCGIPINEAQAYSLNVAVVPHGPLGYLTLWAAGQTKPLVATLNSDGRIISTAAVVAAGIDGAVSVFTTGDTDVVLDINGYFAPVSTAGGLNYYALPPCRVGDTRSPVGPFGGTLLMGETRMIPVMSSSCGVPAGARAYSVNLAAVPQDSPGYLTAWAAGSSQPVVASLNWPAGTTTSNAAIVPAGPDGSVNIFASNDTDLVIDINGYFAEPGAGGLSFYALTPCRVWDSRVPPGTPFSGVTDIDVLSTSCGVSPSAQTYVLKATAVPQGPLGYLTLWAQGAPQPVVASLNAWDGAITGNLAMVPTSNGSFSAYASNPTDLVIDLFGYFAPEF